MITLEPFGLTRCVAAPAELDTVVGEAPEQDLALGGGTVVERVLRLAPDEMLVSVQRFGHFPLGSTPPSAIGLALAARYPHAIVEEEAGFSSAHLSQTEFEQLVRPHIDWAIPAARPALAQGLVAGVPCKLAFEVDGGVRLLCLTAHVHELEARL